MDIKKILREGTIVEPAENSYYDCGACVIKYNGNLYPFRAGELRNPLDPMELLLCLGGLNVDGGGETMKVALQVCRTVNEAAELRKVGFDIVTKYKSGATKVILQHATDNVIILGELAKQKGLILPILSVQLSDENYDQSTLGAWKEFGFATPKKYDVTVDGGSYVHDYIGGGGGPYQVEREITNYNVGDYVVSFIREEGEMADVSDDEDRCWDYSGFDNEYWDIFRKPAEPATPQKTEHPTYVWQDKGVQDD